MNRRKSKSQRICEKSQENPRKMDEENPPGTLSRDDVDQPTAAHAPSLHEAIPKLPDFEIPTKKRKTRRGKSKRRYPYSKNSRKSTKVIKPEAPYNSNQFLLEDHGNIEELDENFKHADKFSTTSAARTRDSSFSVDSDGEFYSSPDDEEQFLIKDFVDQYESVHAERLQSMSKDDLIQEYLMLETKLEILTKRQRKRMQGDEFEAVKVHRDLQGEVERLTIENEALKRENATLRSKNVSSNSEDSETDSNDSYSSTSSSSSSSTCSRGPIVDYSKTNGNAAGIETV